MNTQSYSVTEANSKFETIDTQILVVGCGVAGLRAALAAADQHSVLLLAKQTINDSNTAMAQGGIAAVLDREQDSHRSHSDDTCIAGAGHCDPQVVNYIVRSAKQHIDELTRWGMNFDLNSNGLVDLSREGGHSSHRIIHSLGDATGQELSRVLSNQVLKHPNIKLLEQCFVIDLITDLSTAGDVRGAWVQFQGQLQQITCDRVILATGGCGQLFRETTNSLDANGDGLAMAYRAGAQLADLEFQQFHPTVLYIAGAKRFLISEAVRGEGAYLLNRKHQRFMLDEHELAELAPRDIVSRAIVRQLSDHPDAQVYLDVRHMIKSGFHQRFPSISRVLRQFQINPAQQLIPVRPAMHYMMGGVRVDEQARTSIPGVYACGEVSMTGLHGANRLASNSLLEGLVCGEIAGRMCSAQFTARHSKFPPLTQNKRQTQDAALSGFDLIDLQRSMRSVMWRFAGIERSGSRLLELKHVLEVWNGQLNLIDLNTINLWQLNNAMQTSLLISQAALMRQESRGAHFRVDYPQAQQEFAMQRIIFSRDQDPKWSDSREVSFEW